MDIHHVIKCDFLDLTIFIFNSILNFLLTLSMHNFIRPRSDLQVHIFIRQKCDLTDVTLAVEDTNGRHTSRRQILQSMSGHCNPFNA